jgi:tryptophan 2,3-dioxygenase/ribonuclease HI
VKVTVHVDGGARGNPGPAAAAAVVTSEDGDVLDEAAVTLGRATNNVAEYRGLLLGLERARALGATEVEVVNDSQLIARQVDGSYKVKHPDMIPLHKAAKDALRGFERWSIRSVPRAQNARADALVNRALDGDAPAEADEPEPAAAGGTDYAHYLLIDDLLGLQRPITKGAHDELLFIIVHQSYELWFKLILHELRLARAELERGRPQAAAPPQRRVVAVDRLLHEHLNVLETLGPEDFLTFRDPLAPASGFQSRQFREIESFELYDAFCAAAQLPEDRDARLDSLAELYKDHRDDPGRAALHDVAERLLDHDELFANWRHRHMLMAAREIGSRPGTGGSRGVEYLGGTLGKRFFPELWEVRIRL